MRRWYGVAESAFSMSSGAAMSVVMGLSKERNPKGHSNRSQ